MHRLYWRERRRPDSVDALLAGGTELTALNCLQPMTAVDVLLIRHLASKRSDQGAPEAQ
jgi:hypothetical protein